MSDDKTLYVGMDICNDITQISCFDNKKNEPFSVGYIYDTARKYEFPTVLALNVKQKKWYYSYEAFEKRMLEEYIFFDNIIKSAGEMEIYETGSVKFKISELLRIFIEKIFIVLKGYFPSEKIKMLVITTSDTGSIFEKNISQALQMLGIENDRYTFIDHKKAYMYYAISQRRELWMNNVGLFEFSKDNVNYTQLNIDRNHTPYVVTTSTKNLTEKLNYNQYDKMEKEQKTNIFVNMANAIFYRNIITTVYITGNKYAGLWLSDALKQLCKDRRIFQGENLYTRGACYFSKTRENEENNFVAMDETIVSYNIYLKLYADAAMSKVKIVSAGSAWSEIDESLDMIPDDEDELSFVVENVINKETKYHMLSLSGMSGRKNKTTRYTFRIRFLSAHKCIVTLKDDGFGDFSPSTNRIWESIINL